MRALVAGCTGLALILAGCAKKTATLPDDPIELAATCSVLAAASEREAAGVKGNLSADAQERILHYALLAAGTGGSFDADRFNAVSRRAPQLFDHVIKGKWQTLRAGCAAAFPATQNKTPALPAKPLDAMLDCYVLADLLQKSLSSQGGSYGEVAVHYGVFGDKLDERMVPRLRAAGIGNGPPLDQAKARALAAAAQLGQPPAVMQACEKAYPAA
jgi:hypothetical protein